MAKPELGTKRTCPDTGKRFYDLNKKIIVSPYTNNSWPLSTFETPTSSTVKDEVCDLNEEIESKSFVEHKASKGKDNSINKEDDDSGLDIEYDQEIDLEDDDFLEPDDSSTDSDVVDIDDIGISEDEEAS
ncbi:TIGR02300 family protein [Candidatus Liberibacter brunswickensis]|uniref:TIGR02300 family protein n=1 Tax=Candidatus Liberibacter brunswickensis TaxID=1968796 RepID=UPI002FE17920